MALDPDPALGAARLRLSPYLDRALERAAAEALRLFADAVSPEHLLRVLLEDPESALHRLVEHAFADAQTLSADVLAIAPGILVVGSAATLPFSTRAVEAVRRARAAAARRAAREVTEADVLLEALLELEPEARAALERAGHPPAAAEETLRAARAAEPAPGAEPAPAAGPPPDAGDPGQVVEAGHLFHHFSAGARRALSAAGRGALRSGDLAVAPAHLVISLLESTDALAGAIGLTHRRAALLLRGHTADLRPPPPRRLPPDPELIEFLGGLPDAADSLAVLRRVLARPLSEQAQIFTRQKVTLALLERAQGALQDP